MSTEPTDFPSRDLISENAVRAVFGRRRPTSQTTPANTGNPVPAHSRAHTSGSAGGARRLRRWSVADLIARAVPRPPSTT